MHRPQKLLLLPLLLLSVYISFAQTVVKGKIIDNTTKEPVAGATIRCSDENCTCGCTTNAAGEFQMQYKDCRQLVATSIGYAAYRFPVTENIPFIALTPAESLLQEVVLSANRGEAVKRSEAPIAIANLNSKTIQDAKPTTLDQVLNKVSGVNMVNLGNEQHQMSIRQPITTKSLFLYLEDGIPVRTTGLFNHNALLEFNMAAVKNIEVIKGPSSSLYGSEAIGGVVNFITQAPTAVPVLKLSAQGSNMDYKRTDVQTGFTTGKWGIAVSGYYAEKQNGFLEYSDFYKGTATARVDYRFADKTVLTNSITWLHYYSDMAGGVDSVMFASRSFRNPQTFTYRKVEALRYRSTLTHEWKGGGKTTASIIYRDNTIEQNPAYRVRDDYRRQGSTWIGNKEMAHGEINSSRFNSYAFIGQHRQDLKWNKAVVMGGVSMDLSPATYDASYIRIQKDTAANKYISYQPTDSILTNYKTKLNNYAAFINVEFSPVEKLRVVASLRYDYFHYNFDNHLTPSAFSGSPDTTNHFRRMSPKLGFTYNFSNRTGVYANYSEGFVPPQVTEMYTGVKVPNLDASIFYNYEVGGWAEVIKNKLSMDVSLYQLNGTNEIIAVKNDDGTFSNQNAGKTSHKGIELGLNATPVQDVSFRLSGAYSKHLFTDFVEKGISYNGNEMNGAPNWLYNTEVWYKPSFVKGLRLGAEWQHVGSYYVDPQNTAKYGGYHVLNLRVGYQYKGLEVWVNALNATDNYYSYNVSKSAFGYSYTLAEPRNFNIGLSYDFGTFLKKN